MKSTPVLLLALVFASPTPEAAIPYFSRVRDLVISASDRQNYAVVDEEIWRHSRRDLADVRLYEGETQVPYLLRAEQARVSQEEQPARILNLGKLGAHTEFDIDVGDTPEYDRIRLQLDAKNFVSTALVSGRGSPGRGPATQLGPSTLYEFSQENLGANSVLKVPVSSFRYLHVRLGAGIRPEQVKAASVFNVQEVKARWSRAGECRVTGQENRNTVIACDIPVEVPLDRIQFDVAPGQMNFRRHISVTNPKGIQLASGDISRIRMKRGGTSVESEDLSLNLWGFHPERLTVSVENGDDPPLVFTAVQSLSVERRLYFAPHGKSLMKLYYGDEKLEAPVYDYAKFFQQDPTAARAELGPGSPNPRYSGRPDNRPWSERHKALLWIAMLGAVLALAVLALRGLKAQSLTSD